MTARDRSAVGGAAHRYIATYPYAPWFTKASIDEIVTLTEHEEP